MTISNSPTPTAEHLKELENRLGAHNYHPLGLVIREARGAWAGGVEKVHAAAPRRSTLTG